MACARPVSDLPSIPTVSLDSTLLSPAEQFGSWARHSQNTELTPLVAAGFQAQGTFWNLGQVLVTETRLDPFVSDRGQALVNLKPTQYIQLVSLYQGSVRFQASDVDQLCTAPDMFIRDYSRPSCATASRIHCATVYFARDFLQEKTGPLPVQGLLPPSPEATILGSTLQTMIQSLPRADASSAGFYAEALRDLLAAVLIRRRDSLPNKLGGDRLSNAKAYICSQPLGTINVDTLSRASGLSRSVLYELFRSSGGVLAYDRLRRLRSLYRDLCVSTDRRSIMELGTAHGFSEKGSLTRSFRKAFGCSLQEVRLRSRLNQSPPDYQTAADAIRTAVDGLA